MLGFNFMFCFVSEQEDCFFVIPVYRCLLHIITHFAFHCEATVTNEGVFQGLSIVHRVITCA